jgi:FMN-dependent oxidoreductase (nitrilotriacetate monooxygenase family)
MNQTTVGERGNLLVGLMLTTSGYSSGAWRLPDCDSGNLTSLGHIGAVACRAEEGGFDFLFIGDTVTTRGKDLRQPLQHSLEPVTTIAALAGITSCIGLIATISTSFTEPFNVARYLSSIDHLTGGRVGWNIVTSYAGAENFSSHLAPHDIRYEIAREHVDIVTRLWDSWDDDAVVNDKELGVWADTSRISPVDFEGKHFKVAGPLNIPRSPQGRPVLVQAGSSDAGMTFASDVADAVLIASPDLDSAVRFTSSIHARARSAGRGPGSVKVLSTFIPIVASSERKARELIDRLSDLTDVEVGRSALSLVLNNAPLDDIDLDHVIPPSLLADPLSVQGGRTRYEFFYKLAVERRLTLRELIKLRLSTFDHHYLVGTAAQIAAEMESWYDSGACDGFVIQPATMPGSLDTMCEEVIPILERDGYRSQLPSTFTLRGRLGLARPSSRAFR